MVKYLAYQLLVIISFLLCGGMVFAQSTCQITIQVIDSTTQVSLVNAIVSYRASKQTNWELSYTNEVGRFTYALPEGDSLSINFTYLGYGEVARIFTCADATTQDIIILMSGSSLWMKEVIITERPPAIIQKEDTIIYQVDTFRTGREVKLKEVLNRLPGIHVDRNNEITVKGTKVKEVLLEGEQFFTGDAALAVKYIPADVISQIEILEKYNEVSVLQGQDSGDRLALNVRLKKDRKRFVFGDVSAASDLQERHQLHANSFYYSPQLRINGISDYNTTEEAALSSGELLRLIGLRLNQYDPSDRLSGQGSFNHFQGLFLPAYHFDRESIFGVTQVQYQFKNQVSVEGLVLGIDHHELASKEDITTFVDPSAGIEQTERTTGIQVRREFLKLNISSNPNKQFVLAYDWQYSDFPTDQRDSLQTLFLSQSNYLDHQLQRTQRSQWHEGRWIQEWHSGLQSIIQVRYGTSDVQANDRWQVDGRQIPTIYHQDTTSFRLQQEQAQPVDSYYALGRLNYQLSDQSRVFFFLRGDNQRFLPSASAWIEQEQLAPLGFGYDTSYQTNQWAIGSRYLWQHDDWKLKIGLDYTKSRWTDLSKPEGFQTIGQIAPSLHLTTLISGIGEISLNYDYWFKLPEFGESVEGVLIRDFNQFQRGNPSLQPTRTHHIGISLLRGQQLKGRQYNVSLLYQHTLQPILGGFEFQENNLLWSYQNSPHALNEILFLFRLQRFRKRLKLVSTTRLIYTNFYQAVNGVPALLNQYACSADLNLSNSNERQEWNLQIELGVRGAPQINERTRWYFDNLIIAEYRFFMGDNWKVGVESDVRQTYSKDIDQTFFQLAANIRYTTSNEQYAFQIRAYNLLNQQWSAENNLTSFSNVSTRYALMPRFVQGRITILF